MLLDELLVCKEFVVDEILKRVQNELVEAIVEVDRLCFLLVVHDCKLLQGQNVFLHVLYEPLHCLLVRGAGVDFVNVHH